MQAAPFRLVYDDSRRINWRNICSAEIASILNGDLRPLNNVMEDLAYVDLEKDGFVGTNPEVFKKLKIMQFGIQYLLYSQSHLKTWTEEMTKSAEHEKKQNTAMRNAIKKQKSKIKKLKQEIEDIDLKGMHYDLLTDALKPQNAPLEFKKIEETKVPTDEPAYLAKIKEHLKASAKLLKPDDELLDSDFELSMSVAERKAIPEKVHKEQPEIIKEEAEYENIRSNRFNNPSTFGI